MSITNKQLVFAGIAFSVALMLLVPTQALAGGVFVKQFSNERNLIDTVSQTAQRVRNRVDKVKNRVVNHIKNNVKRESQGAPHLLNVKATKKRLTANQVITPAPLSLLAANGENPSINISDVQIDPQYVNLSDFVNISCVVASEQEKVDVVNITINGPDDFNDVNISMNTTDSRYYYNASYNVSGSYSFSIWAKNETSGNQSKSDDYYFYVENFPPQITDVERKTTGNYVNISCTVTDDDYNETDNVSSVTLNIFGNRSELEEYPMNRLDDSDIYYSNESYVNDTYTYYIHAEDTAGNENQTDEVTFQLGEIPETETLYRQISSAPNNESHPSMVSFGKEKYFAAYEQSDTVPYEDQILFTWSVDNGKNWTEDSYNFPLEGNQSFPRLSLNPETDHLFSTFQTEKKGLINHVDIPDITNTDSWECWSTDWWSKHKYCNFSKPDITYYSSNKDILWLIGVIGSGEATGEKFEHSPMFSFPSPFIENEVYIASDPENLSQGCSNLSMCFNPSTGNITAVYELQNDSLGFVNMNVVVEDQNILFNYDLHFLNQTKNNSHPSISVKDGEIFITAEAAFGGISGVFCYSSTDDGQNWTVHNVVSDSGVSELYPILHSDNLYLYCMYHLSGDLYVVNSTDGISWTEPYQVNDPDGSVVAGYHMADIVDSQHFVWTDNRNKSNYDIWTSVLGVEKRRPEKPLVSIENIRLGSSYEEIQAKNKIYIELLNSGKKAANNVRYWVNCTCVVAGNDTFKDIVSKSPPHYIRVIPAGENQTLELGWFEVKPIWDRIYNYIVNGEEPPSKKYKGIKQINVAVGPSDETENITYESISVSWEEIFAYSIKPSVLAPPAVNKSKPKLFGGATTFNVTVTTNLTGMPISGAIVVCSKSPYLRHLISLMPVIRKILSLRLKEKKGLIISVLKYFVANYQMKFTNKKGVAQLEAPLIRAPAKLLPQRPLFIHVLCIPGLSTNVQTLSYSTGKLMVINQ